MAFHPFYFWSVYLSLLPRALIFVVLFYRTKRFDGF